MKSIHAWTLLGGIAAAAALAASATGAPDEAEKKGSEKPAAEVAADGTSSEAADAEEGRAPDFTLKDTHGVERTLSAYREKWVVLEWINHGCPFVKKHYDSGHMQKLQARYAEKGVVWFSICSSADGKQGHMSPEKWNETIAEKQSKATAVLLDADGKVGRLYDAKVTPVMFVISPQGKIVYQGAIDSIRSAKPDDVERADNYVAQVLDAVLDGKEPPVTRTDAYG